LFLHSRAAHTDLVNILREEGFGEDGGKAVGGKGGVVHSFTGSVDELNELVGFVHWHISSNRDPDALRWIWDFILGRYLITESTAHF